MTLTRYRTLGRSGLVVSPAALGTMTFGNAGWGSDEAASRAVFDAYTEAGGNFIDTADVYSGGRSEKFVGRFIAERSLRDRIVLATKFGFNTEAGNPHAGGNGAKTIHRALDGSLRRLGTDYVDLYWLHVWDMVTPADEVLQTLGDLVRAGKIRYFGLSDLPAWYAVQMATLAAARGIPGPVALQLEYSLVQRGIEREHIPAARALGLGVMPWSPLAGGFLSGKYRRGDGAAPGGGRLGGPNPFQGPHTKFTARNWRLLDSVMAVAEAVGRSPAQVALAWAAAQPGIGPLVLGAREPGQLRENLAALHLDLGADRMAALEEASDFDPGFPYALFKPGSNAMLFGGSPVQGWR